MGLQPLVMAHGHRINEISELPLVVSNGAESITKTKQAIEMLKGLGCDQDLQRVVDSKKVRAGKGKYRNRRYAMRRGPLVVYGEDNGIVRACRNIPGVDTACVDRLNLLQLAPGGSFGRFVIFTEGAFKKLNAIYGTYKSGAPAKKGYRLLRSHMENADIARIINSNEVQSVVRPKIEGPIRFGRKKNPLKNVSVMETLNPGVKDVKKERAEAHKSKAKKAKTDKALKTASKKYYSDLMGAFEAAKEKADAAKAPPKADDDEEDEEE